MQIQERLHEGCEFPYVLCTSYKTLASRFTAVKYNNMLNLIRRTGQTIVERSNFCESSSPK